MMRLRRINIWDDTPSHVTLFQKRAANLRENEWLSLHFGHNVRAYALDAFLDDPLVHKIKALSFPRFHVPNVTGFERLVTQCTALVSIELNVNDGNVIDMTSMLLASGEIRLEEMRLNGWEPTCNSQMLFSALEMSGITKFGVHHCQDAVFMRHLNAFLAKDTLTSLTYSTRMRSLTSLHEFLTPIRACTKLTELKFRSCLLELASVGLRLLGSVNRVEIASCSFKVEQKQDWSFLAGSAVSVLHMHNIYNLDSGAFGAALAKHLDATAMDFVYLSRGVNLDTVLQCVGTRITNVRKLGLDGPLDDAALELILTWMCSGVVRNRVVYLEYSYANRAGLERVIFPALRRPDHQLTRFYLMINDMEDMVVTKRVEAEFNRSVSLFALLQARSWRLGARCALRRLPVDLFRVLGTMF